MGWDGQNDLHKYKVKLSFKKIGQVVEKQVSASFYTKTGTRPVCTTETGFPYPFLYSSAKTGTDDPRVPFCQD